MLVGGGARRLGGVAKGLLTVGGEVVLDRLARVLGAYGPVSLIGDPGGPYAGRGLPVLPDSYPQAGAPGGLATALESGPSGWVFVCATDLPYLDATVVDRLLAARQPGDRAVLPQAADHVQPLAGLWHTDALPPIVEGLATGASLKALARAVHARVLEFTDARPFFNLNTPADLAEAQGPDDERC